jgi:hypothetical protein
MATGQPVSWWDGLERAGITAEADGPSLRAKIERLGLLYEVVAVSENGANGLAGSGGYAIVWSGGRPRDPEVAFGEARSQTSVARALAEALGRFLVKDPGYPVR